MAHDKKNLVVKIQNLFLNHESRPIKSNPKTFNPSKNFKSVKETTQSHISMESLTVVDFFDLDHLFFKGEIPECPPALKWQQILP